MGKNIVQMGHKQSGFQTMEYSSDVEKLIKKGHDRRPHFNTDVKEIFERDV